jgi:acyl-[acyl-carrier-protein] desaturase
MPIAGRDVLVALEPFVGCLLHRHLSATREWFPHEYVPWEHGRSFSDDSLRDGRGAAEEQGVPLRASSASRRWM